MFFFFRDSSIVSGSGEAGRSANGGPSAAPLGCREPRSMGRDVARVREEDHRGREKWRAEVGPMLPGAGPRPSSLRTRVTRFI